MFPARRFHQLAQTTYYTKAVRATPQWDIKRHRALNARILNIELEDEELKAPQSYEEMLRTTLTQLVPLPTTHSKSSSTLLSSSARLSKGNKGKETKPPPTSTPR
jgi:hypothetical protein